MVNLILSIEQAAVFSIFTFVDEVNDAVCSCDVGSDSRCLIKVGASLNINQK